MKIIHSYDGGGLRGQLMAEFKTLVDGHYPSNPPDLIAATSTGAILGAGLALGMPAAQITDLYTVLGPKIFDQSFMKALTSLAGFADEAYDRRGLDEVLENIFGGKRLQDCICKTMTFTYRLGKIRPEPFIFKSWEHGMVKIRDAVACSSAAPTFFEPYSFEMGTFIDGGIYGNNPAAYAFSEAKVLWPKEEIVLISVGTGRYAPHIEPEKTLNFGKLQWIEPLIGYMMDAQSRSTHHSLERMAAAGLLKYYRFQIDLPEELADMDKSANLKDLKSYGQKLFWENRDRLDAFYASVSPGVSA